MNDTERTMAEIVYSLLIWVSTSLLPAFANDARNEENMEHDLGWRDGLFRHGAGDGDDDHDGRSEFLCGMRKNGKREDEREERGEGERKGKGKGEGGLIIECEMFVKKK